MHSEAFWSNLKHSKAFWSILKHSNRKTLHTLETTQKKSWKRLIHSQINKRSGENGRYTRKSTTKVMKTLETLENQHTQVMKTVDTVENRQKSDKIAWYIRKSIKTLMETLHTLENQQNNVVETLDTFENQQTKWWKRLIHSKINKKNCENAEYILKSTKTVMKTFDTR